MTSTIRARVRRVFSLVIPLCLQATLAASQPPPQAPARDNAPPRDVARPRTGSASLSGLVRTIDDKPVPGALLLLAPPEGTALAVTTDSDGHFRFTELPAGRFTLKASKPGFLTQGLGANRPGGPPRPLDLGENTAVEDALIRLTPGCVVAGHLSDELGEPLVEAAVKVQRYQFRDGRRRLTTLQGEGHARTNDRGEFRIYGLPAGDLYLTSSPELQMALSESAAERTALLPTFYPGTANPADAAPIACAAGREVTGLDFSLVQTRAFRVAGVVRGASGAPPATATVVLTATSDDEVALRTVALVQPDGTFALSGVVPGDYVLQAQAMNGTSRSVAMMPLTVARDISGLSLTLGTAGSLTARLVPDSGLTFDFPLSRVSVSLDAPPQAGPGSRLAGLPPKVTDEGIVEVADLYGPSLVRASAPGWHLRAVRKDGVDITDSGVSVRPGERLGGIEIVLTSRTTSVAGSVKTSAGAPVDDFLVVAFADDPRKWKPNSRFLREARGDQAGRFLIKNLPPGTYRVIAIPDVDGEDWADPAWLQAMRTRGVRVTLGEGEPRTIELELTQPPARER